MFIIMKRKISIYISLRIQFDKVHYHGRKDSIHFFHDKFYPKISVTRHSVHHNILLVSLTKSVFLTQVKTEFCLQMSF